MQMDKTDYHILFKKAHDEINFRSFSRDCSANCERNTNRLEIQLVHKISFWEEIILRVNTEKEPTEI